ncbi:MAG TPA: FecR family protein [Burkholderiales bacterium]|nr:FecR family protein [Burkholderiales bacterium]
MEPNVKRAFLLYRPLIAALLLCSLQAMAAPAARVEFAMGMVSAESADGSIRPLGKGMTVEAGDTINTNEGRAQLRFTDGGYVSLYERTVFRIDEYRWDSVADGTERSFFTLLKGALRTITGRIAKVNRKAYLMTTVVATIGIRGTEYTMQLNGSLAGTVAEGEIEVCNGGGCLPVSAGQSYLVVDWKTRPTLAANQTLLSPPPPTSPISPLGLSALSPISPDLVDGTGGLLGATHEALFGTLGTATDALTGTVQDLSGQLLGGTALDGPVQDLTATAGGVLGGTVDALGATTGSVLDTATEWLGGSTGALGGTTATGSGGSPLNLLGL